ncbi:regulator of nonsense transcripts 1 (RENT1) [Chlorella sorokiniana]|uniref:Regulator of nonsense transcripts 1 (RENT1) n=1 Tax=Chlorella sorokiniana TaxID=3076 RepID=A0A2P6TEF8_CHLSO|nr:regulator of nonsense transcripts 1 (RENT1) [Chlorella sorokiniana]|eukprot:PRW21033.1 regulator of nonsense transcripts 1 (RENT1) [Chlorella sorokiniana]
MRRYLDQRAAESKRHTTSAEERGERELLALAQQEERLQGSEQPGTELDKKVAALQARLGAAVRAENEEQARLQRAAYRRGSARRLQDDGLVLLGLRAAPQGRLYGEFVWRFQQSANTALPYHRFKRGDTVVVAQQPGVSSDGSPMASSSGDESDYGSGQAQRPDEPLEGTVLEVQREALLITLPREAADALSTAGAGAAWRLDQGSSSVTVARQLDALNRLGEVGTGSSQGEVAVRALLLGAPFAERLAFKPTEWVQQQGWLQKARQQLAAVPHLNTSQKEAIAFALSRTLTLWQGPPGTGKTRTLLAFIQVLVGAVSDSALARKRQGAILAVGDTNAAADNLLEGLLERGINVVRVGNPAKVRPELRSACLDALAERTPQGRQAAQLREQADQLMSKVREGQQRQSSWQEQVRAYKAAGNQLTPEQEQRLQQLGRKIRELQRQADGLWRGADNLVKEAAIEVLRGAAVVVSTCNGSGESRLEGQRFRIVVLDEASQATEPASLVPLVKGAECVIMAGDQKQLPPTVLSKKALDLGLDVPLFNRLLKAGVTSKLLDVQYRMHPAIAAFPSQHFYKGRVKSGVQPEDRPPVQGVPWPSPECPVLFINVDGREQRTATSGGRRSGEQSSDGEDDGGSADASSSSEGGASYCNPAEAEVAMRALQRLLERDAELQSVALLSPYSGQVRLLSSLLTRAGLPEELLQRCSLAVSTVDGYQGREADAVIFSAVRCNQAGRVGFLADERRLNVAITRPRRGLIVVGNQTTLAADPNWRASRPSTMGNRVARLAYTNEATAAAWAVVGKRGLTSVPATPEAEAQLFTDVAAELRRQALGMPPSLNRTSLAAAVREMAQGACSNPVAAAVHQRTRI